MSATDIINWNDGRLLILSAGQTAKCVGLLKGQIYAVLIYNSAQIDVEAIVTVVWSNKIPPSKVTVRGSTGAGAPANYLFVSGDDSDFISISLGASSAASITAFIVSISMPSNTEGLNNQALPGDGQFHSFNKFDRYYTEPDVGWRSVNIENKLRQFICLQMLESTATVVVVNVGSGLADGQVSLFGPTANTEGTVTTDLVDIQSYETNIQGDGTIWVWMNGDSEPNSEDTEIVLQQLSAVEALLNSGIKRVSKIIGKFTKR